MKWKFSCTYLQRGMSMNEKKCGTYFFIIFSLLAIASVALWSMPLETAAAGSALKKPVIVQITNGKSGKLSITWNRVTGASGYELYRSTSKKGKYKKVKQFGSGGKVSYTDTKLKNGKKYYYKLRAYKKNRKKKVYSSWSAIKSKQATKNIQNTASKQEFYKASSLVVQNSLKGMSAENAQSNKNEYATGRLLVEAKKKLSFEAYKPKAIIESSDHFYVVQFKSSGEAKKAAGKIKKVSGIAYVEGDSYCGATGTYMTSMVTGSWGTEALGTLDYATGLKNKNLPGITVAVIDSGVSGHPLLNARVSAGYNLIEGNGNTTDQYGHGTHVAGIVADNTQGLNIHILPVKVLNDRGVGSNLTIGNGIKYATDMGAKVINISIAGLGKSQYLDSCIQYALNKGASVVVSAGNNGEDTQYYSTSHRTDETIVVGAVDMSLTRWAASNYGSSVDVVAPGVGISSCSNYGNSCVQMTGTSMAAPHISAIVSMLRMENPGWNPSQTENWLKNHTKDLGDGGWDPYYGWGIPDLSSLMQPTSIVLSQTILNMVPEQKISLTANVTPAYQNKTEVSWTSSNPMVVNVDANGNLTATGAGNAVITATTVNGLTANCFVEVKQLPQKVELNRSSITMEKGKNFTILATLSPENVTERELVWTSSNEKVVSVDEGILTANGVGRAEITVTTVNDLIASCEVFVLAYPEKISISENAVRIEKGKTKMLTTEIYPKDAVNTVNWISSDENVIFVENGILTATGTGKAVISAITVNGVAESCLVESYIPLEKLDLLTTECELNVGDTDQILVSLKPEDTTENHLNWSSSNDDVVWIDDEGNLEALGEGSAKITVTAESGLSAVCNVTVRPERNNYLTIWKENTGEEIRKNSDWYTTDESRNFSWYVKKDQYIGYETITDYGNGKNGEYVGNITVTSSDPTVAVVDEQENIIRGVEPGIAVITATQENGLTAQMQVEVWEEPKIAANFYNQSKVISFSENEIVWSKAANAKLSVDWNISTDGNSWYKNQGWISNAGYERYVSRYFRINTGSKDTSIVEANGRTLRAVSEGTAQIVFYNFENSFEYRGKMSEPSQDGEENQLGDSVITVTVTE